MPAPDAFGHWHFHWDDIFPFKPVRNVPVDRDRALRPQSAATVGKALCAAGGAALAGKTVDHPTDPANRTTGILPLHQVVTLVSTVHADSVRGALQALRRRADEGVHEAHELRLLRPQRGRDKDRG